MALASEVGQKSREEILQEAYEDPVFFCHYFLPHLFPGRIPWFHQGIMAIITEQVDFLDKYGEADKIIRNFVFTDPTTEQERRIFERDEDGHIVLNRRQFIQIMCPRGSSKTTIAGIAMPLRAILYKEVEFGVYISESGTHAEMQLDNVRRELESNENILAIFGDLKPSYQDSEKWSAKIFETASSGGSLGTIFTARGRGSQIRGMNHRGRRPDLAIVDDVEDKESVSTEGQRKKARDWFYADVIPALPRVSKKGRIIVLGTLLHREALLEVLAADPKWTVVRFGVEDLDGEMLWPEYMTRADIQAEKDSYIRAGLLHVFYMEYYSQYRAAETAKFQQAWFIYRPPEKLIFTAIYLDPAISKNATADDAVIAVVGMQSTGHINLLDMWGKQGPTSKDLEDEYFARS